MLQKIKVQNFQSWREIELELHPRINVITGVSTSGKTAIFRAIHWPCTNRPSGDRFKSNFAKKDLTKVSLQIDNKAVELEKKTNSVYRIDNEEFTGFGVNVPDIIKNFINLGTINIQDQLEPHFLITSFPGEISKVINQIIQIEEVDTWKSELTTQINSYNSEIKILDKELEEKKKEINDLSYIDNLEEDLSKLEKLYQGYEIKKSNYDLIIKLKNSLKESISEINRIKSWLSIKGDYLKLVKVYESYQKKSKLFVQINRLFIISEQITKDRKILTKFRKDNSLLEEKHKKFIEKETILDNMNYLINQHKSSLAVTSKISFKLEDKRKEFKKYLQQIGKCPICFSDLDDRKIQEIIK